jgi:predicted ATPase/DNA-binding winged helix-turn-helix (wHTH) protein
MVLSFPPYRLDLENERLWKDGEEVRLRRKPFAILRCLVQRPQRLVSHGEIVEAVWGKVAIGESLLRTHLCDLRQVLGEGVVETVAGRGYRFVREVTHRKVDTSQGGAPTTDPTTEAKGTRRVIVGRDAELDVLRAALASVHTGRRSMVFVTGEAGAGKTTVLDVFLEQASATGGLLIGCGTCIEQYGSGQVYLPVLDAVGALCRGRGADRAIDAFSRDAPAWLAQLPGVVRPERLDELQRRAAGVTKAGTVCELAEALEALSIDAPVILAFEDLHWTDPSTAELIAFLGGRRESAKLLIVGTYRPEEVPRGHPVARVAGQLIARRQASSITLRALGSDAVDEYLSKRYPDHTLPADFAIALEQATAGNPLFLATFVDDLEGQRLLRVEDGQWRLSTTVQDVAARRPDSVRRLVDTQIDRLSALEQRIIEVAGVAGMTFRSGVVAHALEADVDDVDSACESLAGERRLLQYAGTETWPDGTIQSRYAFRHALFQHAALARSTAATARMRHRRIAERLEAGYPGHEEAVAGELAVHFEQGQVPAKAARYDVDAGEEAARRRGYQEAVGHFEHARSLFERMPPSRERDVLELRCARTLGWSLFQVTGRGDRAVPTLQRAKELAVCLEDKASLGEATIRLAAVLMAQGRLREASEQTRGLRALLDHVADPGLRLLAEQVEATTVLLRGQFTEAHRLFEALGVFRATEERTAMEPIRAHLLALSMGSFALWLAGQADRAVSLARRAQQVAERTYEPFEHAAMLGEGALLHAWRREPALASELAKRTLAVSEQGSFAKWQNRANVILRWAEAELAPNLPRARVEELLAKPWEDGSVGLTMHAVLYITMCARLDRGERALEVIESTLSTIEQSDERWLEPEIHRLRGEVLQSRNEAREGERSIARAVAIAKKQGSRSLELRATLSLHARAAGPRKKRAREGLARLLSVMVEGHDTPDLIEARSVLAS